MGGWKQRAGAAFTRGNEVISLGGVTLTSVHTNTLIHKIN